MTSQFTTQDLKVAFIGMSHEFSLVPARMLAERCDLVGVIESIHPTLHEYYGPDLSMFARRGGLPFFRMTRQDRPLDFLRKVQPDVICISGMAQRLWREEFEIPRFGAINLHPSLLPNYRGPEPFFWQAREMELQSGVTVLQVDDHFDTGDILRQITFPISIGETFVDIQKKVIELSAQALMDTLADLVNGQLAPRPQKSHECAVYARFPKREDWRIDWEAWPIERVWHFLRAAPRQNSNIELPSGKQQWVIGSMDRKISSAEPGTLAKDRMGYFIAHREGKVYIERATKGPILPRALRKIRNLLRL